MILHDIDLYHEEFHALIQIHKENMSSIITQNRIQHLIHSTGGSYTNHPPYDIYIFVITPNTQPNCAANVASDAFTVIIPTKPRVGVVLARIPRPARHRPSSSSSSSSRSSSGRVVCVFPHTVYSYTNDTSSHDSLHEGVIDPPARGSKSPSHQSTREIATRARDIARSRGPKRRIRSPSTIPSDRRARDR